MDTIVNIENLSKTYKINYRKKDGLISALQALFFRKFKIINAVNGVSFRIEKGEIRALIGPNGAGKSTIIKILSGILYPSGGKVEVMGMNPYTDRTKYVKNIGVLFGQKSQLIWELPAIDTFALHKKIYDIPADAYLERLEYFKDLLNIRDVVEKPVRNLSLGERMKCELVCALLHNPQLVFLDEPTIGMDLISKDSLKDFIKEINEAQKITFILTTHDMNEIDNLCRKVTVINHGRVIFNDSMEELKTFSRLKTVELIFRDKLETELISTLGLEKTGDYTGKLYMEFTEEGFPVELKKIINAYAIKDININPVELKTIIRHFYELKNEPVTTVNGS